MAIPHSTRSSFQIDPIQRSPVSLHRAKFTIRKKALEFAALV